MNTEMNQIENEVVDNNPTQNVENLIVENTVVENLTKEFLEGVQKNKHVDPVYKVTFDHINGLKEKTAEMKIFLFQYKEEVERLYNNEKSIISKSKKKAEELGMTYEEYRAQVKTNGGGGGKSNEYQYEDFYEASGFIFDNKLKLIDKCNSEMKLFWYEVRDEKKRYDACLASKKSNLKKKEKEALIEVVSNEVE
jgi:hypothetical protein